MQRPLMPPEEFSRFTPTFQFPKSLLHPLIRPLVKLQDRKWLPAVQRKQHVVICGFPRSGTTLCQLMIESCVPGIRVFGRERRGLEVAKFGFRTHAEIMTKRPKDIFVVDELRDFYAAHPASVRFIVMCRDPRAVLTSVHFSKPQDYFVSVAQWRHIFEHWKWATKGADVLPVRYEDLILHSDLVEQRVAAFMAWNIEHPFHCFLGNVPSNFDGRALNGLRELESKNIDRWRNREHRDRILSLLDEMPELPDVLQELGYESDHSWTSEFSSHHCSASAA